MASKLALAAFLALLLLAHAGVWLWGAAGGVDGVGAGAGPPRAAAVVDGASGSDAPSRDVHLFWNAACWLFGVGLVVTLRRSSELTPALD